MSATKTSSQAGSGRGEPTVATLLTLFVPGLGHVYMGKLGFGIAAFLVVEGLYALGWWLSDGMLFAFLDPELRGPFAALLAPESANLGAVLLQRHYVGYGPDHPVAWPPWMLVGCTLTALSGIANVVVMCQAHLDARGAPPARSRPGELPLSPAGYVAAAWLVPGLGHVLQRRALRGAIVFGLLVGLFLWGTVLAEGSNLSRERHFYYWGGQFLLGLPALAIELVSGRPPVTGPIRLVDAGLLFGCLAGLLNVLAMIDVYRVAEERLLGIEPDEGGAAEPEADAAPEGSA